MFKSFVLIAFCFVFQFTASAQEQVDSLLDRLDRTMARSEVFIQQKENTITALKKQEQRPGLSDAARFQFNNRLLAAYRQYRFDSALHYVNVNLDMVFVL